MKVLLVDADSHNDFPNLSLMKLSTYYKQHNYSVDLIQGIPTTAPLEEYDKVLISVIFPQNRDKVLDYASQFDNVQIGGSGYDYNIVLDNDIEHIMPDYSLYDLDYSLGFTSRGCIRNCGFCIVPEKEGFIRDNAPISEFLHPDHKKLLLLDNNFQASPRWRENLGYLINSDLAVNFNQGLDIRLLTNEFAEKLSQVKYQNWKFTRKSLNFAFDSMRYERRLRDGLKLLEHYGIRMRDLSVYMLTGYDTTREDDIKRFEVLKEIGVNPYIMRYNQNGSVWDNHFARYVNRRYYQFIDWNKYANGALNK